MKNLLYIIGLFLCFGVGYLLGKDKATIPTNDIITEIIIKNDTIVKRDTLIKEVISPKYVKEEIVRVDTIKADTAINLIQREYLTAINEDSIRGEIRAVISGYNPSLDSLDYNFIIPTKEIFIEKEIIKHITKKQRYNIGFFFGTSYNIVNRSVGLSIGFGVNFNPF